MTLKTSPAEKLIAGTLGLQGDLIAASFRRPLPERELIDRWLILALPRSVNEIPPFHLAEARVYCGYPGQQLRHGPPAMLEVELLKLWETPPKQLEAARWWNEIEPQRADFRQRLDRLMEDPTKALREMGDDLDQFRKELLVITKFRRERDTLTRDLYYFPSTTRAGYGHVLDLLMDSKRGFGKDLRRCGLEPCQAYFLSTPKGKGGPRSKYCSEGCRLTANQILAAGRQERYRERQREK